MLEHETRLFFRKNYYLSLVCVFRSKQIGSLLKRLKNPQPFTKNLHFWIKNWALRTSLTSCDFFPLFFCSQADFYDLHFKVRKNGGFAARALREIWLRKKYRGKGYGKRFFEEFIRRRDYGSIVYYADHPAAITICRQRGYKEDYLKSVDEHVFYLSLKS